MDIDALVSQLRTIGTDTATMEVKSAVGGLPKSVPETLSAFANGAGGLLLLGLSEEDGFVPASGFKAGAIRESLAQACSEKVHPPLRPIIDIVAVEGCAVVVAEITPLPPVDKPCYVVAKGKYGGSFIRSGDGDRRLSNYEVDRLTEERGQPRFDEEVVPGASPGDLDSDLVHAFLDRQRLLRPRIFAEADQSSSLRRLHVLAPDREGVVRPTLGGLLALGSYPQEFFPRLTVTFAAFPGADKAGVLDGSLRMTDSVTLAGPIPQLVVDAMAAVQRNMRTGALIEGVFRRDIPDYPAGAVREAVTNALMHRDYSPLARGTQVQVNMYVDRLEILNPGGLFGTVTIHDLGKAGISSARNQRLSAILEDTPFPGGGMVAENRGSGYAAIEAQLHKALMPPPRPVDDIRSFRLTFVRRRLTDDERLTHRGSGVKEAILAEIERMGSVATRDIMAASGLSRAAVLRHLHELEAEGIIMATEPARSPRQRYRRA